ncbi:RNA-protein complex protein Nop10 [Candidatus Bathyarchaeota archaeon]|nr:RNA-protein complex protein Nop10 [Candidatus Bathyarchaeota archaeon]MBS7631158.1 RNA-protein complex protein Nop10 [Candidatus Bathyarchaeota archaeon]
MVWLLRYCKRCDRYTLKQVCPICDGPVKIPHPAKFSLDDKYGKYKLLMRRVLKKDEEESEIG